MKKEYKCPTCRSTISVDDINVSSDIALCRSCGNSYAFSLINSSADISEDTLNSVPRGIKLKQSFNGGVNIVYHRLSPAVFFLIPFTALWSGLSMTGIYGTQIKKGTFNLAESLFGLPFLIGTIVLLSIILFCLFGKVVVSLNQGVGSVFTGVGTLGWTRHFSYDKHTLVSLKRTNVRVNNVQQVGISITNDSSKLIFGTMLKKDAKEFIAASIMKATGRF
ncbi:MAG: hypothetical protein KAI74_06940 [Kiritimatiellae bacterium]|nr:hypothetical protein [Kiritimatiellia bacterium]